MKFTYDHLADALYIQLIDTPVARSKVINIGCSLDFDADDNVIGIELLQAQKRGLNPYRLLTEFITPEQQSS